ncbi:MAG: hypothetical protein JJU06_01155 [Ectothiorhodospiraceae bacterium]|nr:hypothetical protein [Ectothiorhodospiraceae bacterium]MCH8505914.1 hypothetical protein [Ectothiorhodospiraceae bacterium]
MVDLRKRKQELEEQRDELAERLRRINMDYRRGLDKDAEEQATELQNAEVLQEIARVTSEELGKIESAIQRIEQALRHQQNG